MRSFIAAGSEAWRERARPLLGTVVRIRIPAAAGADTAIDRAFAEVAAVHDLMSFQRQNSDLGRVARAEAGAFVPLHFSTRECLAAALGWAVRSGGAFDPVAAVTPDATWRDLRPEAEGVVLRRPLRLDLSGIAKGYAVDRACVRLTEAGMTEAVVEAGGDLRVLGAREEEVALRPGVDASPATVLIADGALASSDPALARAEAGRAVHLDGRSRLPAPDAFVAVAAPACIDADALTKIALVLGVAATPLLCAAGATAYRHDGMGWTVTGAA